MNYKMYFVIPSPENSEQRISRLGSHLDSIESKRAH